MDFMRILKSLEELLYEVMVLLVFYPRTLWLTLREPQRMMDYADTELGDVQSEQYTDTLSPPLFLMISLAVSHGIELAVYSTIPAAQQTKLLATSENLLLFRVFAFSLLPLVLSLRLLAGLKIDLTRETLRAPFYAQCFITAPFALAFGLALSLRHYWQDVGGIAGTALIVASTLWFLRQQTFWFMAKLGFGVWRGLLTAVVASFVAAIAMMTVGFVIVELT